MIAVITSEENFSISSGNFLIELIDFILTYEYKKLVSKFLFTIFLVLFIPILIFIILITPFIFLIVTYYINKRLDTVLKKLNNINKIDDLETFVLFESIITKSRVKINTTKLLSDIKTNSSPKFSKYCFSKILNLSIKLEEINKIITNLMNDFNYTKVKSSNFEFRTYNSLKESRNSSYSYII